MYQKEILISLLFFISLLSFSNKKEKLDSLNKILSVSQVDTSRINILLGIGDIFEEERKDTALTFYNKALTLAKTGKYEKYIVLIYRSIGKYKMHKNQLKSSLDYYNKAFQLSDLLKDTSLISKSLYNIGYVYFEMEDYGNSMIYYQKSMELRKRINDKKGLSNIYNNISSVYNVIGEYTKCLDYLILSLKLKEELGDKAESAACLNNIANIQKELQSYDQAIDYANRALAISKEVNNKKRMLDCYKTLYSIFYDKYLQEKSNNLKAVLIDSALMYNKQIAAIASELNDKSGQIAGKLNFGIIYTEQREYEKALKQLQEGLYLSALINNKTNQITILNQISEVYLRQNNYVSAISLLKESLVYAEELKSQDYKKVIYSLFSKSYEGKGDFKNSLIYYKKFKETQDSINNLNNLKKLSQQTAKMQFGFKIDLLEKEKSVQQLELDKKSEQMKKQRIIIYTFIFGLIIIIFFSTMLYRQFTAKKRTNKLLEQKNIEVNQKNEEITVQRDEIQQQRDEISAQRDLVTHQKEEIEEIHSEITASITYAKRIQTAVLPSSEDENSILGDHFILFKPKDIVSGDFYWATRVELKNNVPLLIVTVADCTGHGVPGAFMSMLGISFLNEIVRKEEVTQASHVLDHLRTSIIAALKQKGNSGEQKDGMDISFVVLNLDTLECQFAGANNPLWISINCDTESIELSENNNILSTETIGEKPNQSNKITIDRTVPYYELIELKPDKMPVAIYEKMNPFTNHIINLCKGDMIYLASDGFEDQFGGPKNKKFLSKNFKELLKTNSHKPMIEQKAVLDKALTDWKGCNEQVDDITIMGLRI